MVSRFTLDSATEFLFGTCVNSLHSPLPYPHGMSPFGADLEPKTVKEKFPKAFADAQRAVSERPRVGWLWPLTEITKSRTDEDMAVVNAFLEPILQEAIRKKEERAKAGLDLEDKESQENETLLDHLVRQTSGMWRCSSPLAALLSACCYVDWTILHDETLNILLAGRDTVSIFW